MKKIALDIEGTIADIHALFVKTYNFDYRTNFNIKDITNWEFKNTKFKITPEEFLGYVKNLWYGNWKNVLPTEKDLEEKLKLLDNLYKLDIVTNCAILDDINKKHLGKSNLLEWLNKNNVPFHNFITLGLKNNKANLNYDYFIDDNPFLAEEIETNRKFIFLYDRPWNRKVKESRYIKRVYNFSEIIKFLKFHNENP